MQDPDGQIITSEYQIKLRPLVTNEGDAAINIGTAKPSAIRLLVRGSDIIQNWQPRPGTLNYGDKPFPVTYEGTQVWAIAPNRPGTEIRASNGYYTGFANTWNYPGQLAAHQVAGSVEPVQDREDLVFNVPLASIPPNGQVRDVYGLALLNYSGGAAHVIAYTPINEWQRQESAKDF